MAGIEVQLIDQGPATFEVPGPVAGRRGVLAAPHHPDVLEIEELAYGRVLRREVRPLPAGTIRVRVPLDERAELAAEPQGDFVSLLPFIEDVAERVARRILA